MQNLQNSEAQDSPGLIFRELTLISKRGFIKLALPRLSHFLIIFNFRPHQFLYCTVHDSMADLLLVLDILFSLFFVGPFTVLYWRGTFVSLVNVFITGL